MFDVDTICSQQPSPVALRAPGRQLRHTCANYGNWGNKNSHNKYLDIYIIYIIY